MKKTVKVFLLFFFTISARLFAQDTETNQLFSKMFSHLYSNQDSVHFYKDKIVKISSKNKDYQSLFYVYLYSNKSSAVFNNLDEIKNNLNQLDILFKKNLTTFSKTENFKSIKISYLFDKAVYFYKLNDYNNTLQNLNIILDITKDDSLTDEDKNLVNVTYSLLAKIHSNNGEYDLANAIYDKNIRFLNDNPDPYSEFKLSGVYRLKGEVFKHLKDYKTSNIYLKKAFKSKTLETSNINAYITEANNIADNYINLNQLDSASIYLEKIKPLKDQNTPYSYYYYVTNARLQQALNNNKNVENNYRKALHIVSQKWQNKKHIEVAELHQNFADFYLKNGNIEEALAQNKLAINQVTGNDIVNSSINKIELFKVLKQKTDILLRAKKYDDVLKNSLEATHLLDSLKPIFKSKKDKLLLIENAYSLFENGLEASFQTQNLKQSFYLIEKSKSTLLLEALLSTKAEKFSNIPDKILAEEKIYKTTISNLEQQINNKSDEGLKDKLFNTKTDYRKFLDTLETTYKSYYNLKYNYKVSGLEDVKKNLESNTSIISFFYGNKSIYKITLTKDNSFFDKIEITSGLENLLKTFQLQISNPKSEITDLKNNAVKIHNTLIGNSLEQKPTTNLIILADGLLNYIPFESLVNNQQYMVENYAISYANSATLLNELNQKESHKNNVLAFAPSFSGNGSSENIRSGLQALPHNKKEIVTISNYYKARLFFNKDASLINFKNNAENYGILHLATHAIYDDNNPEFSYLAFGNNPEDLLYVNDLYNLNLNANLVTLSACESGIGDLKRGEGFLSLARGFYFGGAKSIASTLWKINDASSAKLMNNFYKQLSDELPKQIALQQSKIAFIKDNQDNALSHPYYWSGFIVSGSTEALNTTNYWVYILPVLALLLLVFTAIRKRKTNVTL